MQQQGSTCASANVLHKTADHIRFNIKFRDIKLDTRKVKHADELHELLRREEEQGITVTDSDPAVDAYLKANAASTPDHIATQVRAFRPSIQRRYIPANPYRLACSSYDSILDGFSSISLSMTQDRLTLSVNIICTDQLLIHVPSAFHKLRAYDMSLRVSPACGTCSSHLTCMSTPSTAGSPTACSCEF
jgi:predicted RND superfamily exporter protein